MDAVARFGGRPSFGWLFGAGFAATTDERAERVPSGRFGVPSGVPALAFEASLPSLATAPLADVAADRATFDFFAALLVICAAGFLTALFGLVADCATFAAGFDFFATLLVTCATGLVAFGFATFGFTAFGFAAFGFAALFDPFVGFAALAPCTGLRERAAPSPPLFGAATGLATARLVSLLEARATPFEAEGARVAFFAGACFFFVAIARAAGYREAPYAPIFE